MSGSDADGSEPTIEKAGEWEGEPGGARGVDREGEPGGGGARMMNPVDPTPLGVPLFALDAFTKDDDLKAAAAFGISFPPSGWDPTFRAWAVATEFAAVSGWQDRALQIDPGKPDDSEATLAAEIKTLLGYMVRQPSDKFPAPRARFQEETVVQAVDFLPYFYAATGSTGLARPATRQLIVAAHFVAGSVAAYYKLQHNRARPSQVFPWLFPRLQVPGHASYPSGHALQATVIARALRLVVPVQVANVCGALAERVGLMREYAGLHWPSDTMASKTMAPKVLFALGKTPSFCKVANDAATEWGAQKPYEDPRPVTGA